LRGLRSAESDVGFFFVTSFSVSVISAPLRAVAARRRLRPTNSQRLIGHARPIGTVAALPQTDDLRVTVNAVTEPFLHFRGRLSTTSGRLAVADKAIVRFTVSCSLASRRRSASRAWTLPL
jgi:hypothetical protein